MKAQDVIVIERTTPDTPNDKQVFICRVVAVAGDTVEINDSGRLVVNGIAMQERNIFYPTPRYEGHSDDYPMTLGEGECFVLADHREDGADSRYFGAVSKDQIVGTVITIMRRNHL